MLLLDYDLQSKTASKQSDYNLWFSKFHRSLFIKTMSTLVPKCVLLWSLGVFVSLPIHPYSICYLQSSAFPDRFQVVFPYVSLAFSWLRYPVPFARIYLRVFQVSSLKNTWCFQCLRLVFLVRSAICSTVTHRGVRNLFISWWVASEFLWRSPVLSLKSRYICVLVSPFSVFPLRFPKKFFRSFPIRFLSISHGFLVSFAT